MSILSDELSDFTNETEEFNILFEKIRNKESVSKPIKEQTNFFNTSAIRSLKISNSEKADTSSHMSNEVLNTRKDVSDDLSINPPPLPKFSKEARLATFSSTHSFVVSSFGDDYDEDELLELVEKKYKIAGNNEIPEVRQASTINDTVKNVPVDEAGDTSYLQISSSINEAECDSFTENLKSSVQAKKNNILANAEFNYKESVEPHNTVTDSVSPFEFTDDDESPENYDKHLSRLEVLKATDSNTNDAAVLKNIEIIEGQKDKDYNDYGEYFSDKRIMQQKEDEEYIEWNKRRMEFLNRNNMINNKPNDLKKVSSVFKDCVIHVSGYTIPGLNELHKLVITNGGRYLSYLVNKSAVTHIIASTLTPSKMKELQNCKVVSPQWILDSLKLNQIQDWTKYSIVKPKNQNQLNLLFNKKDKVETNPIVNKAHSERITGEQEHEDLMQEDNKRNDQEGFESNLELKSFSAAFHDRKIDSNHPDFLKNFFANSRLHHLSTWRSAFKAEFILKSIKSLNERLNKIYDKSMLFYIDFDCFFAAVSSLNHNNIDFKTTPVCVTHGKNTSDISSCNYVARKFGVQNGMWVNNAKQLCPNLIRLNYDFPSYERISRIFYNYLLAKDENGLNIICVLPISVDECIIEVSLLEGSKESYLNVAKKIKNDIQNLTSCDISVGISNNKLLSRLCLKKAKPNGIFFFDATNQDCCNFLKDVKVRDLPGVGHHLCELIYTNCFQEDGNAQEEESGYNILLADLYSRNVTLNQLINWCNTKTGNKIYKFISGFDNEETIGHRENIYNLSKSLIYEYENHNLKKDSISINVNWGIRFKTADQVNVFLQRLSKELIDRLNVYDKMGSLLSLRIMVKIPNTETAKYLGLGYSEPFSKSANIGLPTNDIGIISTELQTIFKMIFNLSSRFKIEDIRGIGIKMSKLVNAKDMKQRKIDFKKHFEKQITQNNQLNESFFETQNISKDIYSCLPNDIQNELKLQYQCRKLDQNFNMKNNIRMNQHFKKRKPLTPSICDQEISITQSDISTNSLINTQDVYFLKNPDVDKKVFEKELSSTLQADVIDSWKKQEFILQNQSTNDLKRSLNKMKHAEKLKRHCSRSTSVADLLQNLNKKCINIFERNHLEKPEKTQNYSQNDFSSLGILNYSEASLKHHFWKIFEENQSGPTANLVSEIAKLVDFFVDEKDFRKLSLVMSLFDDCSALFFKNLPTIESCYSKNIHAENSHAENSRWTWCQFNEYIKYATNDKLKQFNITI